ncbi:beta-galactosidase [Macrococcoides goetzii]|uniref:Beta-galactosidase n=1 Tax=Macrococcoides goetzii TaxID=1891097 RepID=A0A395GAV7_9STAP|nr:beta-galactosidase family protein [Macrococcus goetzii]RAI81082.1 beta-galactosidase [Macrococcus goetzii]
MSRFKVEETFKLDGQPFHLLSGAIHYFRSVREDWEHKLYNLKALGFNTVETYVPWNWHELREGQFDFSGNKDLKHFIELAQSIGLYVIVRPSPFICAEWEFGGLPAWLLKDKNMKIRTSDPVYLEKVNNYYKALFKILTPLQVDNGGPILMFQIENEYGSFYEDKKYLKALKDMMIANGVTVPLFTSDGAWKQCLDAGHLVEEGVLPTGNFGSRTDQHFDNLEAFMKKHNKQWPIVCMEFWDGWFNRWGDKIIKRDKTDLAEQVKIAVERGHVNLYMFHGGTNFGFFNGCSARGTVDLPQITSYDYDAPLDEAGNPTAKYFELQKMLKETLTNIEQQDPITHPSIAVTDIRLKDKVSLHNVLDDISTITESLYPQSFEALDHPYGYVLYRTEVKRSIDEEKFKIIDARDRVQLFLNHQLKYTAYQQEIGEEFTLPLEEHNQIDVLVENMGRVNYGYKLFASTQYKGLGQGLMMDLHFVNHWKQYAIDFDRIQKIDYTRGFVDNTPAFYRYEFNLDEIADTYLDMSDFGKGIAFINGFNLGRYWEKGPIVSLYISKSLLKHGKNEIVVFDTEGKYAEILSTRTAHKNILLEKE